jgi:hypothetical protein
VTERRERREVATLGERGGGVLGSEWRGLCGVCALDCVSRTDTFSGERERTGIGAGFGAARWDVEGGRKGGTSARDAAFDMALIVLSPLPVLFWLLGLWVLNINKKSKTMKLMKCNVPGCMI